MTIRTLAGGTLVLELSPWLFVLHADRSARWWAPTGPPWPVRVGQA